MIKKRTKGRTVAQLLSIRSHSIRRMFQHIQYGDRSRHTYVYCKSAAVAKRFPDDAEKEGFLFADGAAPTSKETNDIFALSDDFTISYMGIVLKMDAVCERSVISRMDADLRIVKQESLIKKHERDPA